MAKNSVSHNNYSSYSNISIPEAGASKDPCSDTYCGPKAFSEIEVRSVAEYLLKIPHIKAFIDFHSYSQLWMSPWGYMKTPPVDFKVQVNRFCLTSRPLSFTSFFTSATNAHSVSVIIIGFSDLSLKIIGMKFYMLLVPKIVV